MYLHQKFLLIMIPVSGLLMKPCKAALIETERGFPVGRRLVVASGHLLLPDKGTLVNEPVRGSHGRRQCHQTLPPARCGDGGKAHSMPTASLCLTDESGSHCSGVSQVQ